MIYFDTAYLLKFYLEEPYSTRVQDLAYAADTVASCLIGRAECRAGVHRHLRESKLSVEAAQAIFRAIRRNEEAGFLIWLPVTPALIERVCTAFETLPPAVFLRAADALHLACAAEHNFEEIYSNDRHLLAAASHFGVTARNVIP